MRVTGGDARCQPAIAYRWRGLVREEDTASSTGFEFAPRCNPSTSRTPTSFTDERGPRGVGRAPRSHGSSWRVTRWNRAVTALQLTFPDRPLRVYAPSPASARETASRTDNTRRCGWLTLRWVGGRQSGRRQRGVRSHRRVLRLSAPVAQSPAGVVGIRAVRALTLKGGSLPSQLVELGDAAVLFSGHPADAGVGPPSGRQQSESRGFSRSCGESPAIASWNAPGIARQRRHDPVRAWRTDRSFRALPTSRPGSTRNPPLKLGRGWLELGAGSRAWPPTFPR